jgi:hypothetical protein
MFLFWDLQIVMFVLFLDLGSHKKSHCGVGGRSRVATNTFLSKCGVCKYTHHTHYMLTYTYTNTRNMCMQIHLLQVRKYAHCTYSKYPYLDTEYVSCNPRHMQGCRQSYIRPYITRRVAADHIFQKTWCTYDGP